MFLTRVSYMASSNLRALISCSYCFIRSWGGGGWKVEREVGRVGKLEGATLLLVRYVRRCLTWGSWSMFCTGSLETHIIRVANFSVEICMKTSVCHSTI